MDIRELPPAEWLHEKRCFANALICAVENYRDNEDISQFTFAISAQDGAFNQEAQSYLETGLADCTCEWTCPHGLAPWTCRPAACCEACIDDTLAELAAEAQAFARTGAAFVDRWSE